jgi:hypothetical protein
MRAYNKARSAAFKALLAGAIANTQVYPKNARIKNAHGTDRGERPLTNGPDPLISPGQCRPGRDVRRTLTCMKPRARG